MQFKSIEEKIEYFTILEFNQLINQIWVHCNYPFNHSVIHLTYLIPQYLIFPALHLGFVFLYLYYRPAKCFYITSLLSDKVLDVKGDKASAGSPVIIFDRKSEISVNQLWYEDEHGILRSKLNGYVMDASGN